MVSYPDNMLTTTNASSITVKDVFAFYEGSGVREGNRFGLSHESAELSHSHNADLVDGAAAEHARTAEIGWHLRAANPAQKAQHLRLVKDAMLPSPTGIASTNEMRPAISSTAQAADQIDSDILSGTSLSSGLPTTARLTEVDLIRGLTASGELNKANSTIHPERQPLLALAQLETGSIARESIAKESILALDALGFASSGSTFEPNGGLRALPSILHNTDLPRHISQQIIATMRHQADAVSELHLSPSELGRVRISLVSSDAGMVVSIVADRPETLELMRRHVDLLAKDFHEIGYDAAEFSFGQSTSDDSQDRRAPGDESTAVFGKPDNPTAGERGQTSNAATRGIKLDRVDIRV